ncbi:MAG: TrkA family potassium uptake protein [Bacteroidales bacterium]|nr:TrkA family potassium uptake protein [Bacteroidales bacterium]
MKSFLIIGLGSFGRHLAIKLTELGNEVMVIDKDEEKVDDLVDLVTAAKVGDCQDEEVLRALGVRNFDVCFVCVRDDFQTSLEVTCSLKELGAQYVVAHAERERQMKFLKMIGADEVIHSELDMAARAAVRFSARGAFEYVELIPEYAVVEIAVPPEWVGQTVAQVGVRQKYNLNIIGFKNGGRVQPMTQPNHLFSEGEHLIIAGSKQDALGLMKAGK